MSVCVGQCEKNMRFIITFLVVAVASLALTWYIGYDYNTYEYHLIKSIVVKVNDYLSEDDSENVDVDNLPDPSDKSHAPECHSWYTLHILMEKLFKRFFESFDSIHENPSNQLNENLSEDLKSISIIVDTFDSRLTSAINSLPEYMLPVRVMFESMQADLFHINEKLQKMSDKLFTEIYDDSTKSGDTMLHEFGKFVLKMGRIIAAEDYSAIECICAATTKLDVITELALKNVNLCIDGAEIRFREIFNITRVALNGNLDYTIEALTESYETPVSMMDNLFKLPLHVRISDFIPL